MNTHSAKRLCGSNTSRGPDFVATSEKLFCDMTKKQAWPLCDENITLACFDVEVQKMRNSGARFRKRDGSLGEEVPEKSYKTSEEWK